MEGGGKSWEGRLGEMEVKAAVSRSRLRVAGNSLGRGRERKGREQAEFRGRLRAAWEGLEQAERSEVGCMGQTKVRWGR